MIEHCRHDYNDHRPHTALQMVAPVRFARARRQAAPDGQGIPFTDPATALRSPANSCFSTPASENVADSASGAVGDVPAALLCSSI
jgi:hypothetical protein